MRYIIKMDILEEKSKELSEYVDNNFKTKINELKHAFDNITWRGKSKKTFLDGYKKRIEDLSKIAIMLEFYSSFMKKAADNYTEANNETIEEWNKILKQLFEDEEMIKDVKSRE